MNLGRLEIVLMDNIEFGERRREDYGDLIELQESIKSNGLINPIAVQSDSGKPPYKLAAGGRRFLACKSLDMEEISCRIYDHPLTSLELKTIELLENVDRKDMEPIEEGRLKRDIHNLMIEIHGQRISTSDDAPGWSMRDTAKLLGKSVGGVSDDIKLAMAAEAMPQLGLENIKTKSEGMQILKRVDRTLLHHDLGKRADQILGDRQKKLADSYIIGDFFERIKKVPNDIFSLVEIDPPYAIDLQSKKKSTHGHDVTYGDSYNEIDIKDYPDFMLNTLKECYRVMHEGSWLILWFAPEPWFELMFDLLTSVGFKTRRIPAVWTKATSPGQTMQPDIYLGNAYEMFYYARKGDAKIVRPGRGNKFDYAPVPAARKLHPTERPVEMMEDILSTFCWESARVLVPYAGSGNTLLAANNQKMLPIGFDLAPEYKDGFISKLT